MREINLDQQIKALFEGPQVSQGELAIWGGKFKADKLAAFLDAWDWTSLDMPWHIWEWVSDIIFEHQSGPPALLDEDFRRPQWLERARFFGPGGDLELRRDGDCFLWRFVGRPETTKPCGFFDPEADYWTHDGHAGRQLHVCRRKALLWGQELAGHPGRWHDDRVARARLTYPAASGQSTKGRAQLRYNEYLYGDDVEAVWWQGIESWEVNNG